jgi:hypothetical protein
MQMMTQKHANDSKICARDIDYLNVFENRKKNKNFAGGLQKVAVETKKKTHSSVVVVTTLQPTTHLSSLAISFCSQINADVVLLSMITTLLWSYTASLKKKAHAKLF